jgi:hypothetical protein
MTVPERTFVEFEESAELMLGVPISAKGSVREAATSHCLSPKGEFGK